jgi:hypothetical protein
MFSISKRQKVIITSSILAAALFSIQFVPLHLTLRAIGGMAVLAYALSLWSLWEGISRQKAIVLLILPTLFAISIPSYYYLSPMNWWVKVPLTPLVIPYGLSFYSLLLSQNVFNVASIRTIPLYRAASTVAFLFTLLTAFLLFNVIFSFSMLYIFNGIAVFLVCFPLILQMIWSINMENIDAMVVWYSLVLSLIMGEIGLALSFWPINGGTFSLILSPTLYVLMGITTHLLKDRLQTSVVWEYVVIAMTVFFIAFIFTSWTG